MVVSCVTTGDPQNIDLILAGPLAVGMWSVIGSTNIQTATSSPLTDPRILNFNVTTSGSIEPVNAGSLNDTDADVIRKHLNAALKGDGWDALIAAVATGEKTNRENAQLAFDQLFISTASGLYLDREASDAGIERPINMGMSDDTFRLYTIRLTNNKLTEESFLEILEVFYGDSSLRASDSSAQSEPYFLNDGDDLSILIDEEVEVPVVFSTKDFAIISQAKAVEIAAAITRYCRLAGSLAYAAPVVDPTTGETTVQIFSGALGLSSSVRVQGGKAQNVLQFSTLLPIYTGPSATPTWNITADVAAGTMRFTTTSNAVDLSQLQEGDYVNIFGSEFNVANRGSFTVTAVSVTYPSGTLTQYFEVENRSAVQQLALVQTLQGDLLYFRPTKNTIHTTSSRAVIVSVPGDRVDVVLPATSQAVSRSELSGAYAQGQSLVDVTSLERVDGVVTAIAPSHDFLVGDTVYIEGARPVLGLPTKVAGDGNLTTDYSHVSVSSLISATNGNQVRRMPHVCNLGDGSIAVAGGIQAAATPNQHHEVLQYGSAATLAGGVQYTLVKPAIGGDTGATFAFMGFMQMTGAIRNGQAIQIGGTDFTSPGNSDSTRFILPGGSVDSGSNLAFAVAAPGIGELNNGKILAFGGQAVPAGPAVATSQIYDPLANTWTADANMVTGRLQASTVHIPDTGLIGEIFMVTGGRTLATGDLDFTDNTDMGPILNDVEFYLPGTPAWARSNIEMQYARFGHQSFYVGDGFNVIVMGGWGYDTLQTSITPELLNTCEMVTLNGVIQLPSMKHGRAFFAAVQFGRKIYVAGGNPDTTDIEIFDLDTFTWSISIAKLDVAMEQTAGAALTDNLFVVACGYASQAATEDSHYRVISLSSESSISGGLNGTHKITAVIDGNTFQYETVEQDYVKTGACTAQNEAAAPGEFPGPFSFDIDGGIPVTDIESDLTMDLDAGLQYEFITVTDATQFPDEEGWLVFDFGYQNMVYPVKYFGRLSTTELALDFSFVFPKTVLSGAKVCLLQQKSPWVPTQPQLVGSFYLTDSPSGRIGAEQAINDAAAAGVEVDITVTYPGDRGLGNEGSPDTGTGKTSDVVWIFGGDQ